MGTIFHKVMEILAKIKLAKQQNKRKINDEIVDKYSTNLAKLDIDYIIDAVFDYYSKANDHHIWDDKDRQTVAKWVEKALQHENGTFNPLNQNIVEPEQHFDIQLEEEWASNLKLKGTIDLLIQSDEDTYEIVDYKTGKRINWGTGEEKTYEKLMNDFQLKFYHLAASILYPDIETILVTIYYVNDGGAFTIPFHKNDLPETKRQIRELYETIRYLDRPQKRRGFHCRFCAYSKTTFENSGVLPIVNVGQHKCHFTEMGENMSMCDQTDYVLKYRDVDTVILNMTKEGFTIDKYHSPGSV